MVTKPAVVDPAAPKTATPEEMKAAMMVRYPSFAGIWGSPEEQAALRTEFGNDLIDLIIDVSRRPKVYALETAAGQKAFDVKLQSTTYYNTVDATKRAFDLQSDVDKQKTLKDKGEEIAAAFGELSLSPDQVQEIALAAARGGYATNSIAVSHLAYQRAGKNTAGAATMLAGSDAANLKKIANSYGYHPANEDEVIQNILTGKPDAYGRVQTAESFTSAARNQAMALYPHLKASFDAGSTVEDVFGSYRSLAARLLDKTEDSISLNDPMFSAALGTPQSGQMNLSDWMNVLKTDPQYGYQYTNRANQDANNLAQTIARAFGKVQ